MNLILLKINNEQFAFTTTSLSRAEKNILESISQGALDDKPELSEMTTDEVYDWFVSEVKKEKILLEAVGIELELKINI